MNKYLVDEVTLLELIYCAEVEGSPSGKDAQAILDAGPVPEPHDMSDEAALQAYEDYCLGIAPERADGWFQCWKYLRGEK